MLYICISKISLPYFLHVSLNHSTCFVFFIIKFRSIGARKRIFSAVLAEWDTICENERIGKGTIIMGQPSSATANKDLKETIIDVNPEARSTLLELQAERFRKLEEANWNTLQRKISLSIKQAHREQDNRAIVQAQEVIGAKNDDLKRLRQKQREELFRQQEEAKKKKEADHKAEVKRQQEFEAAESYKLQAMHEKEKKDAKKRRELMETDRLAREKYTQDLKVSIYKDMERQIKQKEDIQAQKDFEFSSRINAQKKMREKEIQIKRKMEKEKVDRMKEKMEKAAEEKAARIKAELDHTAQRVSKQMQSQRPSGVKDAEIRAKVLKAKKQGEDIVNKKIEKTKAELEIKDQLAQQELAKVKIALTRRKNLRMIRQEAYELAASRRKKANDYREAKLQEQLRIKEEKYQAIKGGYAKLEDMRRVMHEICKKTEFALNDEIHNLHHKNEMSPTKVAQKAMEVSKRVLFPNLSAKFSIEKPNKSKNQIKLENSKYRADSTPAMANWDEFLSTSQSVEVPETSSAVAATRATTAPAGSRAGTAGKDKRSLSPAKDADGMMKTSIALKAITPSHFNDAVVESKTKQEKQREEAEKAEAERRAVSAAARKRGKQSPSQTKTDVALLRELHNKDFDPMGLDGDSSYFGAEIGVDAANDEIGSSSGKVKLEPIENNLNKYGQEIVSKKSTFDILQPVGEGEFRREHSRDHPLAMGQGKYEKEKADGKVAKTVPKVGDKKGKKKDENLVTFISAEQTPDYEAQKKEIESMRKKQNEILLRVLEDEKNAEEQRMSALRNTTDPESRANLELIFAEERKRASERILQQTKENEALMKKKVLATSFNRQ